MKSSSAARNLDIVLRSATGLKKVRMAAYAVAWIEPSWRVPSPLDKRNGRNPEWNATISIALDDRAMMQAGQHLHIELLGQGLVSTKRIGFVTVDMTDIWLQGAQGDAVRAPFHEYPVRMKSGRQQGLLNFELCLQASPSRRSPAKQEVELHLAQEDASSVPPREQYYQRESTSRASTPPLPQNYPGESVSTNMEKGSRNSSRKGNQGNGLALPMVTTDSRGPVPRLDEISLLHFSY